MTELEFKQTEKSKCGFLIYENILGVGKAIKVYGETPEQAYSAVRIVSDKMNWESSKIAPFIIENKMTEEKETQSDFYKDFGFDEYAIDLSFIQEDRVKRLEEFIKEDVKKFGVNIPTCKN